MPWINLTDDTWTSVTVAQDELWQCRSGQVLMTKDTIADETQGIEMIRNDARIVKDGETARVRRATSSNAQVWRDPL